MCHDRAVSHEQHLKAPTAHSYTERGRSACVCEFAEQLRQLPALILGEGREHPLLDLVDHLVEQLELSAARAGDRHDVAPTVTGVDGAFDESALLQLVEHGHDIAAVDACAACEVGLADGPPFLERGEEAVVVATKSAAADREGVVEERVRASVVAADQPGRPVADPGGGGAVSGWLLGHRGSLPSLWVLPTISYIGTTNIGNTNTAAGHRADIRSRAESDLIHQGRGA
jgi:hypothetical protein